MRSELESVVLGVLGLIEPCTAYAVRRTFDDSISAHWSSSSGSIYPLLRRLERDGLVRGQALPGDTRSARRLSLTARGRRALRAWLHPPLPAPEALIGYDPLRTRLRFLELADPAARPALLAEAGRALQQALVRVRAAAEALPAGDVFYRLTHRSAELALQAQLEWLREVAAALPGGGSSRTRPAAPTAVRARPRR